MSSRSRTATVAGGFFLITELAAIAALVLFDPVVSDARYVAGAGADTRVLLGGFFEVILVLAIIGTAVTLYPVLRKHNESVALGYVCGRVLEATVISVGILSLLSVVTLRQDLGGAAGGADDSLVMLGQSLVAIHDWTFLFGPGFVLGANSLLLAYVMYRSRLVPRFIALLGLVGGPLIFASATAVMFGLYDQVDAVGFIAALPVFAWEVSLAVHLILKGFRPSSIAHREIPSVEQLPARMSPA